MCKGLFLIMKGYKIFYVFVFCLVKRKVNISIIKSDEVCNVKWIKMEKKNIKVLFKGIVILVVEKVKKSIEIFFMKWMNCLKVLKRYL